MTFIAAAQGRAVHVDDIENDVVVRLTYCSYVLFLLSVGGKEGPAWLKNTGRCTCESDYSL